MRAADELPIGAEERDRLLAPVSAAPALALAVSGGADSLALMALVALWRRNRANGPDLLVLTVDHRLRPSSGTEAASVMAAAARFGLPARVLTWDGPHPDSGIEAAARAARYRLLGEAAVAAGATHILTGHHRGDQAETFVMRLSRGSGVHGLAAMRAFAGRGDGPVLFRPLLGLSKARLAATAAAAGLEGADDAWNRDARFQRPRIRRLIPLLAAEGLDEARLAGATAEMARAAEAIDHYASGLLAGAAIDGLGTVTLDRPDYRAAPEAVRLRVLTRLLQAIGGGAYPPRGGALEALDATMTGRGRVTSTLAGVAAAGTGETVRFVRELGRTGLPELALDAAFDGVWDHRFRLRIGGAGLSGLRLGALGHGGASGLGLAKAGAALPALRRGDELLFVAGQGGATAAEAGVTAEAHCLLRARIGAHAGALGEGEIHPDRVR